MSFVRVTCCSLTQTQASLMASKQCQVGLCACRYLAKANSLADQSMNCANRSCLESTDKNDTCQSEFFVGPLVQLTTHKAMSSRSSICGLGLNTPKAYTDDWLHEGDIQQKRPKQFLYQTENMFTLAPKSAILKREAVEYCCVLEPAETSQERNSFMCFCICANQEEPCFIQYLYAAYDGSSDLGSTQLYTLLVSCSSFSIACCNPLSSAVAGCCSKFCRKKNSCDATHK